MMMHASCNVISMLKWWVYDLTEELLDLVHVPLQNLRLYLVGLFLIQDGALFTNSAEILSTRLPWCMYQSQLWKKGKRWRHYTCCQRCFVRDYHYNLLKIKVCQIVLKKGWVETVVDVADVGDNPLTNSETQFSSLLNRWCQRLRATVCVQRGKSFEARLSDLRPCSSPRRCSFRGFHFESVNTV